MKSILKLLLGFNAIALIHLARFKPRLFYEACQSAFTASRHATTTNVLIPEISLDEILTDRKPIIRMPVQRYEDGMLPSNQAMTILAILVAENPNEALEIGTFMGHTTRQMAENLPTATIHTVDLPIDFSEEGGQQHLPKDDFHLIQRRIVGREYEGQPCAFRIKQHFADTATWDFHEAGAPHFSSSTVHTPMNAARTIANIVLTFAKAKGFLSGTIAMTRIQEL